MPADKTNAMRFLDARKVPYETFTFPPSIHSAQGVAEEVGVPAHTVFKTLVVIPPEGKALLVLAPGDGELDLHRLAGALGMKKLRMATQKEAEKLTGLLVGGISALALLEKGFRVYIDRSALKLEHIMVSAGRRGINLRLRVADLLAVTSAQVVDAVGEDG